MAKYKIDIKDDGTYDIEASSKQGGRTIAWAYSPALARSEIRDEAKRIAQVMKDQRHPRRMGNVGTGKPKEETQ